MANETEKLTINLGIVELAQIDVLVEKGMYSNRSDFIRTSIRNYLETKRDWIEDQLVPMPGKKLWVKSIGIHGITKKWLETFAKENGKLNISVIGMLVIDKNVDIELFKKTAENIIVRGKLVASNEIKEIIKELGE